MKLKSLSKLDNIKLKPHNPHIYWKIRCIHSQTKEFFDRYLVLDKSSLNSEDYEKILLLEQSSRQKRDIIKYRKYFMEIKLNEFPINSTDYDYFGGFFIYDYFEDENNKSYDEVQMMSLLTGQENPIIMGNLKCVLQLGPSPLIKKEEFTQNDSDTLAHFIQVYSQIAKSKWMKEECRLISRGHKLEAFTPAFEYLVYVLIYFRQLYSTSDALFKSAFKTYINHIEDKGKILWLTCEYEGFENQLNSALFPPFNISFPTKDIIETFLYGASIMHSITYAKKNRFPDNKKKLRDILNIIKKEKFAFILNGSLKLLFNHVSRAACLIRMDYSFWLKQKYVPPPDILWHEKLFD